MKEDEKTKAPETAPVKEGAATPDKAGAVSERQRNAELWKSDGAASPVDKPPAGLVDRQPVNAVADGSRDRVERKTGGTEDKPRAEAPSAEQLHSMIDDAWARREDPGRFDTGGKTAVLYSGASEASEHRREALGKSPGESIHSGELADRHTADDPKSIRLEQTAGGRELDRIQQWVNSDAAGGHEHTQLQERMNTLWEDGSKRFAESAREQRTSVAYVEHAKDGGVYRQTERPALDQAPNHRHMTDAPLEGGKPPKDDKYLPGDLDKDGKMHRA